MPDSLNAPQTAHFAAAIAARAARQPVSQITGERMFWGRTFRVTSDVLDPRPETEMLVAAGLEASFATVLDLGTGTGCILLSLLADRTDARGTGLDLSAKALAVAAQNAAALGLADRVRLGVSDWFDAASGQFDLIVANPPYIAAAEMADLAPEVRDWEPHLALTPGDDGLAAYHRIAAGCGAHLAPGGRLIVETGATQAEAVAAILRIAGFAALSVRQDMDGRDRIVIAQMD